MLSCVRCAETKVNETVPDRRLRWPSNLFTHFYSAALPIVSVWYVPICWYFCTRSNYTRYGCYRMIVYFSATITCAQRFVWSLRRIFKPVGKTKFKFGASSTVDILVLHSVERFSFEEDVIYLKLIEPNVTDVTVWRRSHCYERPSSRLRTPRNYPITNNVFPYQLRYDTYE